MEYQIKSSSVRQRTRASCWGGLVFALVGCSSLQAADYIEVKVFFDGDCPKYVDDALAVLDAKSAKKIHWVAHAIDDPNNIKTDAKYAVYFDPFQGKTDDDNNNGVVKSKPLDNDIPGNVLFKYTILADNTSCSPLDPFFRVR